MEQPVVIGEDGSSLLERLLGKEIIALAYVPEANAAILQFDADTAVYFRVQDGRLTVEVEAPCLQ